MNTKPPVVVGDTFRLLAAWLLCAGMAAVSAEAVWGAEDAPPAPAAEPTLSARCGLPFRDGAVLQQHLPLPVWGHSLPGARVTVAFHGQTHSVVADEHGAWRVVLQPMTAVRMASVHEAPEGLTMTIVCEKDGERAVTELRDLLVGEVWLCAGQSNMAGKLGSRSPQPLHEAPDESPVYPGLRQMVSPQDQAWLVCSAETLPQFKKVCYYFARSVHREIGVPVGIINAAVGGSKIEPWLNQEPYGQGAHYQRMIEPLVGYGLRGVVWYQGESNASDGRGYLPKLQSLITGWRGVWQQPDSTVTGGPRRDFSFCFVQLPGIGTSSPDNPAGGDGRAEIREAQQEALALVNTGMAVTIDIGAEKEHPPNKYDTGLRLARLALYFDYARNDVTPTGPSYETHHIEGSTIRVTFGYAESGLMLAVKEGMTPPRQTPDAKLQWLGIQNDDGTWHWADARIEGTDLIVSSPQVRSPIAVRYAYTNHPVGTLLYNKEGLPAAPFTTCGYDAKQPFGN